MKSSLGLLRSLSLSIRRSLPKSDGYYMPAEWCQHSEVLMLWPVRTENWKREAVPVRNAFSTLVKVISGFEHVTVGVCSKGWDSAVQSLGSHPNVTMKSMEYDDIWMRDTGPTFLISGAEKGLRAVDWDFNCWGMLGATLFGIRYDVPYEKDKIVARKVLEMRKSTEYYKTDGFVLEGGSIHVDGEGTVLTTAECLLNKNRNPHLSKESIEKYLHNYLGAEKVIWLPRGLTADSDTNGHVDNICCFTGPGSVLLAWSDDPQDEQFDISREALSVLENTTDARGRKLIIHKMPIPPPMFYTIEDCLSLSLVGGVLPPRTPGERLAASYINFYLPNGKKFSLGSFTETAFSLSSLPVRSRHCVQLILQSSVPDLLESSKCSQYDIDIDIDIGGVVAPSFDAPTDLIAQQILEKCFPDRMVVLVPARDILLGGGNIHCITQQVPIP